MRRTILIGLVGAVTVVAVLAVALRLGEGSSTGPSLVVPLGEPDGGEAAIRTSEEPAPDVAPFGALDQASGSTAAVPGEVAGGTGGGTGGGSPALPLPQTLDRKIIRTATLTLEVEDVGASVQEVERIAGTAGGFVSSSNVFVEEQPPGEDGEPRVTQTASITIRIPGEAYTSVMRQLRGLAVEVQSESSEASDVTEEFTDLEARLRNLEATESQYLQLLARAEEITDILTVQDRINSVRLEIERIQGRMNLLNDLTDLATITTYLRPPAEPVVVEEPHEPGWAEEAWDNAWEASEEVLTALGTGAIVFGVVLAWLAVPALAIAIGWRLVGPRRQGGGQAGGGTAA